ncbi:MAG: hypothetical protein NTY95_18675 [Bacteroidia bacterium]|nr:hypothetical protein [Bacteroidia bacterium]
MKANRNFEKIYELLEQFDFKELPVDDRIYVLSEMTENEYNNMRDTLKDTETFFSNSTEPNINGSLLNSLMRTNHKPNILSRILNQPVKFYQLAASILLLIGLYIVTQYSESPDKNSSLPKNDTIYIQKTDTVSSKLADTVRNIKEKIIYVTRERDINSQDKLLSTATFKFDSGIIVSPGKNDRIKQQTLINYILSETLFKN